MCILTSDMLLCRKNLAIMLYEETCSFLNDLNSIWEKIDIEDNVRDQRGNMIFTRVKKLYEDILANEQNSALFAKITAMLNDLNHLEKELRIKISYNRSENISLDTINELEKILQPTRRNRARCF